MKTSVTLQTVADALGVSRSTVSNAYSRPDQLSDELRQRIFDLRPEKAGAVDHFVVKRSAVLAQEIGDQPRPR